MLQIVRQRIIKFWWNFKGRSSAARRRKKCLFYRDWWINNKRHVKFQTNLRYWVTNPQLKVFVFFSSIERFRALTVTPELEAILSYPNVFVKFLNATELSIGSPLEDFIRTDKLSTSSYKVEHTSDALRLLVLWKYGGIYVDTDMIVRKNFDKVPSNFACRQSSGEINGAIIGFNSQKDGKTLARMFLANLTQRFDGQFFPANGPVLITRVVKGLCGTNDLKKIIEMKSCQGFHSLNNSLCYEISYPEWKKLMEENFTEEVLRRVENSVAVHFWNHVSRSVTLKSDSRAAYTMLGRQFCPKVMESCGEFF